MTGRSDAPACAGCRRGSECCLGSLRDSLRLKFNKTTQPKGPRQIQATSSEGKWMAPGPVVSTVTYSDINIKGKTWNRQKQKGCHRLNSTKIGRGRPACFSVSKSETCLGVSTTVCHRQSCVPGATKNVSDNMKHPLEPRFAKQPSDRQHSSSRSIPSTPNSGLTVHPLAPGS